MRTGTKLPARLYADLVGMPFAEGGRGPTAYDCLGLAIELQRRQGREVRNYASTLEEFHREYEGGVLGPCMRLPRPVPGCVVLFRTGINERHLGTMVDQFHFLHTMCGIGSAAIERILEPSWNRRVLGYFETESR